MAYVLSVSVAMDAGWLGGLLILLRLLGEFDGEQGLDAGVEVEDFTGPAGTNRSGVWMAEAVHPSQLIMLCLPVTAAEREVVVPSQVLSSLTHALQSCPSGLVNGQASESLVMVTPP